VLRALDRRRDELPWPDRERDPVDHLALTTAHPAWVVRELLDRFDLDRTEAILLADDEPPGLTLRATGDRDALVDELAAGGADAVAGWLPTPSACPGRRPAPPARGRGGAGGTAGRGVAAGGAGRRCRPGGRVLDLCAGPGGKTTYLAALVGADGPPVVAVELHPHRAELVREAAERQGVAVEVHVGDAEDPPLPADARFDVVLLDAPCTGSRDGPSASRGPLAAHPGRRRPARRAPAAAAARGRRRVAPGGRLVYSVCTWTHAETDAVADWFDAQGTGLVAGERRQLLPDRDDTDGMYVAVWERDGPATER
jgi:16S rRNA (cytosine967-C5)-methyltransferase